MRFEPRRPLGRTGRTATRLGIGDLADRSVPLEQCVATARRAIDAGLNVIDTAPGYEAGYSEEIVGRAVRGVRDRVFVIDKIDHHDQPVAPQIDASLGRLGLERVDLFVMHGLSSMDGWRSAAGPGGAMNEIGRAITLGKCAWRGISSHSPDVLRAAILSGLCDVVLFAVGPFAHPRYSREILPLARERGVGTVCFKTFGAGKLLGDTSGYGRPLEPRPRGKMSSGGKTDAATASAADSAAAQGSGAAPVALPCLTPAECVHYTLTCDPDVALLGMSFPNEQDAAFAAAESFVPLSAAAMADLERRAAEAVKGKGDCWWNPT